MRIEDFRLFSGFQVVFPRYQDNKLRQFANNLKKAFGKDVKINRKATYEYKKLSLKDKDIEFIEFKNSKKGLLGLFLCLIKFEELIEIRLIRDIHKFELPRTVRDFYNQDYNKFERLFERFIKKETNKKLKLKDIDISIYEKLKQILEIGE
ncbi:MAG: hypothetical protein P8Y70_18620 [Candidatus Lokiarchaeota archaeon]